MRVSTAGDFEILPLRSVETVKWVALGFMLIEHVCRYVLDFFPAWSYVLGRTVFPLFAMCLGVALSKSWGRPHPGRTVRRLILWCAVAAAFTWLVRPAFPINVLMTLALGLTAYAMVRERDLTGYLLFGAAIFAGVFSEFGPYGVAAVALCCAFGERQGTALGYVWLVSSIGCICVSQMSLAPALALLVAAGLGASDLDVPRVRHVFYWGYALQWPVLFGATLVLR